MYKEIQGLEDLKDRMKNYPNMKKISKELKSSNQKQTLVIDVEDTIVSRIDIKNSIELQELRKNQDYKNNYIEVKLGPTKIQVYEIRPYVYEFFRAIEPFFEIIVYSCLHHQILEQIVEHLEEVLNQPANQPFGLQPRGRGLNMKKPKEIVYFKFILHQLFYICYDSN